MSENVFDRHPFDDGQTHAAHLKVGGLEPPRAPAAGERDAEIERLIAARDDARNAYVRVVTIGLQQKEEIARLNKDWTDQFNCALKEVKENIKLRDQIAEQAALLERSPHREYSDYEKHSLNGDDAIQFSVDCPRCVWEAIKKREKRAQEASNE